MLKLAVVAPAAIATVAGTTAEGLLEDRDTTAPPDGAGAPRVTVQTLGEPPTTEVGLSDRVNVFTAVIVSVAVVLEPTCDADIVEVVFALTDVVAIAKLAVVAPAAIVTDAGAVALDDVDDSETDTPPAGAAEPNVTVPVDVWPPVTVDGYNTSLMGNGAMVSVALAVCPPEDAEMELVVPSGTTTVDTIKVAVVAPAGTVAAAGRVAAGLLEVSVTGRPPVGAGLPRVTVPVEVLPPTIELGLSERPVITGEATVRTAVLAKPNVAVIVAPIFAATGLVLTVNVDEVAPAGIVTDAGTIAAGELEVRETEYPPTAAAPPMVTVPVAVSPPATLVGLKLKPFKFGVLMIRDTGFTAPL